MTSYCLKERLKETGYKAECGCPLCIASRYAGVPDYSNSLYPQDQQEDNNSNQSRLGDLNPLPWPGHSDIPAEYKAVKHDQEKLRFDLIDPHFLHQLAAVLTFGAEKYSDDNWLRNGGLKWSRIFGGLMRHSWAWFRGEQMDSESNLSPLAHAAAMLMMLCRYDYDHKYKANDDRLFVEDDYFEGMEDEAVKPHMTKAQVERL